MMPAADFIAKREELRRKIQAAIRLPSGELDATLFNNLALELFSHQYRNMAPYRRLCDSRDINPGNIDDFSRIPPVPAGAFKERILFCGPESEISAIFQTSGTTGRGLAGRSCFSRDGLGLMETSILVNAKRMIFPDTENIHILVMAPNPEIAPQMIMVWGMSRLIENFGADGSSFLIGENGLDMSGLVHRLQSFEDDGLKVVIIGATSGLVNTLEYLKREGIRMRLPEGSRTMDAGGYKGGSKKLSRGELESLLMEILGIEEKWAVNLLGMTELASQFYDDTIRKSMKDGLPPSKLKQNPPWTKTRALDPITLQDTSPGEEGVLCHLDLANLDTPMCILTDDAGIIGEDGFEILGRLTHDDPRGCSITVDELTRNME